MTLCNGAVLSLEGTTRNTMGACKKMRYISLAASTLFLTTDAGTAFKLELGGGGSAIPCGFVLPAASAKLVEGDCEPEVRLAAPLKS